MATASAARIDSGYGKRRTEDTTFHPRFSSNGGMRRSDLQSADQA
ncbi:hypothetical protein [Hyphomicrobium sp. D-2]|nr:hypothetical protein [Hyphomicrobium sp. D-2]MDH4981488.1 hypothetical protein [Hyphomicrobium sp. D-2]